MMKLQVQVSTLHRIYELLLVGHSCEILLDHDAIISSILTFFKFFRIRAPPNLHK